MKQTVLILLLAASAAAATAQTPAKPAVPAKPATTATPVHHAATTATASAAKLPPGVPVVRGIVKPAFTLRYEDIKIGAGAEAEPNKMYKVLYTGYLGSNGRPDDGHKFDSSDDHRPPLKDKDGKPVLGDDGKPKLGDAQPMAFPQGMGRLIPGFDQGFAGMKIGGKRRLFIPWQLAYGTKSMPDRGAEHPGIPAKSDLIFDVELVSVADAPAPPPMHQPMGAMPGGHPMPGANAPHPGMPLPPNHPPVTPGTPPTAGQPAAPATTPAPATPPAPAPSTPPATSAPTTPPTSTAPAPQHQ